MCCLQAAQANLILHLKLLVHSPLTPAAVSTRAVIGIAGLHVEASMPLLSTRPAEAVRMLQSAYQITLDQMSTLRSSSSNGDIKEAADLNNRLEDSSLQLLRLLLTCHLGSGAFEAVLSLASSFLKTKGFQMIGGNEVIETATASEARPRPSGSIPSWDIWLLSLKARAALQQQADMTTELKQAMGMNCGLDLACAALQILVKSLRQVRSALDPGGQGSL